MFERLKSIKNKIDFSNFQEQKLLKYMLLYHKEGVS